MQVTRVEYFQKEKIRGKNKGKVSSGKVNFKGMVGAHTLLKNGLRDFKLE